MLRRIQNPIVEMMRRGAAPAAVILAMVPLAAPAHAAAITFTYNCTIVDATTCTTGGPFGTLTLTDSIVDPNRIDLDLVLNGPNLGAGAAGVNNFFLNYDNSAPFGAGLAFKMVAQSDPAGTFADSAGVGDVSFDSQGPLGTTLDIRLNPVGSTPSLTFSASLVLRSNVGPAHTEYDLDVSMFDLKDANNLLYSAFNTLPGPRTFSYGAATAPRPVPEPASLGFFVLGLAVLGAARRRRTAA